MADAPARHPVTVCLRPDRGDQTCQSGTGQLQLDWNLGDRLA
jgi:hypothetical protein